jgi:hypothetical protein
VSGQVKAAEKGRLQVPERNATCCGVGEVGSGKAMYVTGSECEKLNKLLGTTASMDSMGVCGSE